MKLKTLRAIRTQIDRANEEIARLKRSQVATVWAIAGSLALNAYLAYRFFYAL